MATAVLDTYNHNVNHPHVALKKPLLQGPLEQHGLINPKQLIGQALHERVEAIDHEMCEPGDEDTFFVADLGEVYRQHLRWKKNLPRVRPFYGEHSTLCDPYPYIANQYASRQVQPRCSDHQASF